MLQCLAPMPYGYYMQVRFVAMMATQLLLPQRLIMPPTGKSHGGGVNNGVLGEQSLDVLSESVGRIDGIEPVGDIAQVGVEFIGSELSICYPCIGKSVWKAGIDNDDSVPETGVVSTDVANNGDTAQPTTHILKLRNTKTTADSLFGSAIVHVAVEFGKCSHRCDLHSFPYRRHGGLIVFLKMGAGGNVRG